LLLQPPPPPLLLLLLLLLLLQDIQASVPRVACFGQNTFDLLGP
jgi:hypothetical protein